MNYASIVADSNMDGIIVKSIASLLKHNDCDVLLWDFGISEPVRKELFDLSLRIKFISKQSDTHVTAKKILHLYDNIITHCETGDKIFALDADLFYQGEIFSRIREPKIYVTTRHYDYWYVINSGVWGLMVDDATQGFVKWYTQQLKERTWEPYVKFQERFGHPGGLYDFWSEQDFLCSVYENRDKISHVVEDMGYRYNFCPSVEFNIPDSFDTARRDILEQYGNSEYLVLHFKGKLKEVMEKEI